MIESAAAQAVEQRAPGGDVLGMPLQHSACLTAVLNSHSCLEPIPGTFTLFGNWLRDHLDPKLRQL